MRKQMITFGIVLVLAVNCLQAFGQEAAATADKKVDEDKAKIKNMLSDQKLKQIRELEYEHIDIKSTPLATKVMAIMALNEVLGHQGQIAKRRLGMLEEYISDNTLNAAYLKDVSNAPDVDQVTFEQAAKMAIAYVESPLGKADFEAKIKGFEPDMLQRMLESYYLMCKKNWADVIYNRHKVESMSYFLYKQDKLGEMINWATKESKIREAQMQQDRAQQIAANKDLKEQQRQERVKIAAERREQENERRMQQMELYYNHKATVIQAKSQAYGDYYKYKNTNNYNTGWGYDYYGGGGVKAWPVKRPVSTPQGGGRKR